MDKPNHHRWRLHLMPASLRCSKTCAPKTFDSSDCNSDKNPQWDPFSRLKTRANGVRHFPDNNFPKSFRFPSPSNDLFTYFPHHSGPWQSDVHLPANLPQPHPGSTGSTRLNAHWTMVNPHLHFGDRNGDISNHPAICMLLTGCWLQILPETCFWRTMKDMGNRNQWSTVASPFPTDSMNWKARFKCGSWEIQLNAWRMWMSVAWSRIDRFHRSTDHPWSDKSESFFAFHKHHLPSGNLT